MKVNGQSLRLQLFGKRLWVERMEYRGKKGALLDQKGIRKKVRRASKHTRQRMGAGRTVCGDQQTKRSDTTEVGGGIRRKFLQGGGKKKREISAIGLNWASTLVRRGQLEREIGIRKQNWERRRNLEETKVCSSSMQRRLDELNPEKGCERGLNIVWNNGRGLN